jgi:protein-L-isoaspartate(D-aspartate) O-methyltransferase
MRACIERAAPRRARCEHGRVPSPPPTLLVWRAPRASPASRAALVALGLLALSGCSRPKPDGETVSSPAMSTPSEPIDTPETELLRRALVEQHVVGFVRDARVLEAMRAVPRHAFMPGARLRDAYGDHPFPIGHGQTISQPSLVARMTELLELSPAHRVLEIGTGSGYQAALLSRLAKHVYSIELVEPLGHEARARLTRLGYHGVTVRVGDGYRGWPEEAPFDRIMLTAAPDELPSALAEQLAEGGVLVAPLGAEGTIQKLVRMRKRGGRLEREELLDVRFVPMVRGVDGDAGR